jgi:hypothetical protein
MPRTMRRMIFGGLATATLALPTAAFATKAIGNNINPQTTVPLRDAPTTTLDRRLTPHMFPANGINYFSRGAGQQGNDVPAHVTGPGATKIDDDTRRPVNDVQVGQGTTDTMQNKNPPPVQ